MQRRQQRMAEEEHNLVSSVEASSSTGDGERENCLLEASPLCRLQCLVLVLVVVSVGFVAALNEATVTYHENHRIHPNTSHLPWYKQDNPNLWVCLVIKCLLMFTGICSIIYMHCCVLRPGKIAVSSFIHNPSERNQRYNLQMVHRLFELPAIVATYRTKMFISIFIIFAILGVICSVAETISDVIDIQDQSVYKFIPYADAIRCLLLIFFIALQTAFFVKHNRACLQWKLQPTWFAISIVFSVNLCLWFFYVSQEISQIVQGSHVCNSSHDTLESQLREQLTNTAEIMFPFLIEYFIMGAILCGSFLSNTGCLARELRRIQQQLHCLTTDAIRDRLFSQLGRRGAATGLAGRLRKNARSMLFGLLLVASALLISVLMKLFVCDREPWHVISTYILVVFYATGSVCSVVLLRAFRSVAGDSREARARTAADRLMLWCGVVAVLVNDLHRFWRAFQRDDDELYYLQNSIGTALVTVFNICQSVLQVYVLECILLQKLKSTGVEVGGRTRWGEHMLVNLMLINAIEWLVSAVAFSLYFFSSSSSSSASTLALSVISAPLQVFFRFHSIGCIHEFRKHFREGYSEPSHYSRRDERANIVFPTMTSSYGAIF